MVQNSRIISIVKTVLLRFFLLVCIVFASFFTPIGVHDFVQNTLGYIKPDGFFGFTFADWEIAALLVVMLLAGIIFGSIGKRVDYVLIFIIFTLTSLDYYSAENMTWKVYAGLVGAAVIGNLIGLVLKILRKKFFKKSWLGA